MKRLVSLLVCVLLLVCSASADGVDLSSMTFDELVALREQINLAIWNSQEWQEVTVPAGVWEIGVDIPEGHWTIKPDNCFIAFWYGNKLNDAKTGAGQGWDGNTGISCTLDGSKNKDGSWRSPESRHEIDLEMKSGMYMTNGGAVIFTPYTGKPDLGFH